MDTMKTQSTTSPYHTPANTVDITARIRRGIATDVAVGAGVVTSLVLALGCLFW